MWEYFFDELTKIAISGASLEGAFKRINPIEVTNPSVRGTIQDIKNEGLKGGLVRLARNVVGNGLSKSTGGAMTLRPMEDVPRMLKNRGITAPIPKKQEIITRGVKNVMGGMGGQDRSQIIVSDADSIAKSFHASDLSPEAKNRLRQMVTIHEGHERAVKSKELSPAISMGHGNSNVLAKEHNMIVSPHDSPDIEAAAERIMNIRDGRGERAFLASQLGRTFPTNHKGEEGLDAANFVLQNKRIPKAMMKRLTKADADRTVGEPIKDRSNPSKWETLKEDLNSNRIYTIPSKPLSP